MFTLSICNNLRETQSGYIYYLLFAPWGESWVISSIHPQLWVQMADPKPTHPCHYQKLALGTVDPPSSYDTAVP